MFIASCTYIIQRLTAWQDDGRAVTTSVIPLKVPASTQTLGYQLTLSPDGTFWIFQPYTKVSSNLTAACWKRSPSGENLDTTFSQETPQWCLEHAQRLTDTTSVLFQVTLEVFPAGDCANVFHAASTCDTREQINKSSIGEPSLYKRAHVQSIFTQAPGGVA